MDRLLTIVPSWSSTSGTAWIEIDDCKVERRKKERDVIGCQCSVRENDEMMVKSI